MFAKVPEEFNDPNSPYFPGINRNGSINKYPYQENFINYTPQVNNSNNMESAPDPNFINKASQDIGKSWYDNINCNIAFLQVYFDFETDEIIKRLIASFIPFNKNFINLVEKKPDLYGPFWIYTTLIFIVACAGSLTKYIQGATNEDYFQKFIPLGGSVIYGIGFCLPLLIKVLMYIFGSETSYVLVLNIYAYSFTIYAPVFILCIPFEKFQWILLFLAVFCSTGFLLVNFWKELNKYIQNRKYFILIVIGIFQVSLFLVFKIQFFAHISKHLNHP
jgi:hypothetical protein